MLRAQHDSPVPNLGNWFRELQKCLTRDLGLNISAIVYGINGRMVEMLSGLQVSQAIITFYLLPVYVFDARLPWGSYINPVVTLPMPFTH